MFQVGKKNTTRKLSLPLRRPQAGGADDSRKELTLDDKYFQNQDTPAGCGRNALNNLFGGEYFITGNGLPKIENENDLKDIKPPVDLHRICNYLSTNDAFGDKDKTGKLIPLQCPENENYDSIVLITACGLLGYLAKSPPDGRTSREKVGWKDIDNTDDTGVIGYIVNFGAGHWVAYRKLKDGNYKYINGITDINNKKIYTLNELKKLHRDRIVDVLEIKFTGRFIPILDTTGTTTNIICDFNYGDEVTYNNKEYSVTGRTIDGDQKCSVITIRSKLNEKETLEITRHDFHNIKIIKKTNTVPDKTPANSHVFNLPLDNTALYSTPWESCKNTLNAFDLVVDKKITFPIVNPSLDDVKHMILARHYRMVGDISKKEHLTPIEFFNQIESSREYHARQCIVLCINQSTININEIKDYPGMDQIDKLIYNTNTNNPLSFYEMTFLVNHMMVKMATLELKWFPDLIKEKYAPAIMNPEEAKKLPSHLRLLSRYLRTLPPPSDPENVQSFYPHSLLLNYPSFYPFVLYHTGVPPV